MSDGFVAGFAARHDLGALALAQVFAPRVGFSQADVAGTPRSFSPQAAAGSVREPAATHYSPADRDANPTQGWDPLNCDVGTTTLDPLAEAHAAGYAEGLAAAAADMQVHTARDQSLLADLAQGLAAGTHIDRGPLAERLRATVLNLVQRIVGEVGIAPDVLAARIAAATDCLADASESAMLRVHPDDVALIEGRVPRTVFAVGDAALARGSFVLESASTVVEDGPDAWLEQLGAAIDKIPTPRC